MTGAVPAAREQILDAAESLFARQGLEATTIKQIGEAADLNPALLYYYFDDKEKLFHAVLERALQHLIERGSAALAESTDPRDAIRALAAAQVEFILSHPNVIKLVLRELLDHDARHAQPMLLKVSAALFQRLCDAIRRGQQMGLFRPELEPRFAAVSTISQVIYFSIARPAVGIFFGKGPGGVSDDTVRAFGRHAGDFAVSALTRPEPA